MKYKLILFILNIYTFEVAQGQVNLEGRVLAKKDSSPVFNAHIFLPDTENGTSTNAQGYFKFKFDDQHKSLNLLISCIGYSPTMINITEGGNTIFLEEEVLALEEIIVKPIEPKKILETALENFQANYYSKAIEKSLYYNENVIKNGQLIRKLEVIADVGSKGFESNHKNANIFIKQKRPILNKDETFNGANGIEVLYLLSWTKDYLKKNMIKKHKVSFKGKTSFLSHDVYRIDLTRPERLNLITSMYITEKEHAIVAIRESFENNKQNIQKPSSSAFYFIESIQYVDFMQAPSGKWHVNSIDDFRVSNRNDTITEIRRYIKVLSVQESKIESKLMPVDSKTDLYKYDAPYDEQFWNNFNAPVSIEINVSTE
jgi:hypothetical protein